MNTHMLEKSDTEALASLFEAELIEMRSEYLIVDLHFGCEFYAEVQNDAWTMGFRCPFSSEG